MKPVTFAAQATAFADAFEPPLAQLFAFMEPAPLKWADQLADWCALCRSAPEEAFAEDKVAQVLETLVSLMHARLKFGLCSIPRYGCRPNIMVSGDLGGAVLAEAARDRIMRLVLRRDHDMACRLARLTLRRIEEQRRTIAEMIGKTI